MFQEWIQSGLKKKGRNHADLAEAMGVERTVVTKIANGTRQLKADEIAKVSKYFGEPAPSRMMPIRYTIGAGGECFAVDSDDPQDYIPVSDMWGVDAELAVVKGSSMWPLLRDGAKLFFGPARAPQHSDHNEMRVVRLADDRMMVKIMKRTPDPTVWDLESLNAPPIEARVVVAVAEIIRADFI